MKGQKPSNYPQRQSLDKLAQIRVLVNQELSEVILPLSDVAWLVSEIEALRSKLAQAQPDEGHFTTCCPHTTPQTPS